MTKKGDYYLFEVVFERNGHAGNRMKEFDHSEDE